jgi:hypothetical protein
MERKIMTITIRDYFGRWIGHPDATLDRRAAATLLLTKVTALLSAAHALCLPENPVTGTMVAGLDLGGFRPQDCKTGAKNSSHKEGRGIDIYDPDEHLDNWLTDAVLERYDLYREAPSATRGWCHLTDRPPVSKHRTFLP